MKYQIPARNMIRLNCILSVIISTFVLIFLYIANGTFYRPFILSMMGMVLWLLISFVNILLLKFFRNKYNSGLKFKTWYYGTSYLSTIGLYLLIWPFFAFLAGIKWSFERGDLLLIFTITSVILSALIIIVNSVVLLQHRNALSDMENANLKIKNAEATNLLLKQQVHPHFLLNSLNILKSLYRDNQQSGETYLVHLANFLRASISDHNVKLASLTDELTLLDDYLQMQKIRFENAIICKIGIDVSYATLRFLPAFTLQPLLENAIKHNEVTEDAPLVVDIQEKDDWVIVTNNIQPKKFKEPSSGQGLANLSERYKLLSGEDIVVHCTETYFSVSVKLLNYANSNYRR